jgi:hypothetical protein
LVTDKDGALKVELITDINTKLKGVDKNNLTIKDEFYIDPENNQLIDPKTGMPLEQIQKSYFTGNELNWYNQPYTAPFTGKYPGLDLQAYPKTVSSEPLQAKPKSRWNTAWNLIGKPAAFTPYVLPFSYPGFAARNKFSPNASKVTVDYLGRQRELGPQAPGGMTFGDQPFGTQYADFNLQGNRNYLTGRNFMIGAGLLGAGLTGGYLYYNRDTKDWEVGAEDQPSGFAEKKYPGYGYSFDPKFGRSRPAVDYKENNYGLDSMYINNGDTIHDKGWGELAPGYKTGGAHKKRFLKNIAQMFEPGGEAQDPSLGRGSRMDNLNKDVANKRKWIGALKQQSDKAASEELYDLVSKSGDPQLMNIFMGDGQNQGMQQPMQNRPMAEGGDPCPEGSYWDEYKKECVPFAKGVPSKEEIFNNPQMLDYINKLNKKRNVQDYNDYRQNKLIEYRDKNYKGPMIQDEEGNPSIDFDSPEYQQFRNSEEYKKLRDSLPNPEFQDGPFNFPEGYEQKDYYPKEGEWDERSKYHYNKLFNPEPSEDENYEKRMEQFLLENPDYQQQLDELRKNHKYQERENLKQQYYQNIPEEQRKYKFNPGELQQERYDDWCPCQKTQEIIVQGQPVQHTICVPCEQAQVGGYVNMDAANPLSRFVYGGNEPDYYESDMLPEAANGGVSRNPMMKYQEWYDDQISPDNWPGAYADNNPDDYALSSDPAEKTAYDTWYDQWTGDNSDAEAKRFEDYQGYMNFYNSGNEDENDFPNIPPKVGETKSQWLSRTTGNPGYAENRSVWDGSKWVSSSSSSAKDNHNCPPGSVWIEAYGQCVPMMKTNYNQRVVSGDPGLQNIFLPWNRIRKTLGYEQQRGDLLRLKDMQKYSGKSLGDPYATLSYRKNMLSPKRQLDIWNPDGKLSEADMRALMDYGVGSGWKNKGSKNKGNASNYSKSKSKEEKLSKTELIDRELKKDEWNKENWDERIANNKSNLRNARRTFAFENPEFRRFSDNVVFKQGRAGHMEGTGENARWEQQGNYYDSETTKKVKEKKPKNK